MKFNQKYYSELNEKRTIAMLAAKEYASIILTNSNLAQKDIIQKYNCSPILFRKYWKQIKRFLGK